MRSFLRDNGLSLVMVGLFGLCLIGHAISGYHVDAEERTDHGAPPVTFAEYLLTAHFGESLFENWESEFLQMASYVVLTAKLYQRGSAESRPLPDEEHSEDEEPFPDEVAAQYSWLYQHSLSLSLGVLFLGSFVLHAVTGWQQHNVNAARHGVSSSTFFEFCGSAEFWFQSFQNWQSEYLSVAALIILSIFLRERGSPESKSLTAAHWKT
ncbi:MAG TPA: DUF6766 family protein [Planctomycetaceae bacterium]|nr:DUF6766 family protein [Planctomycetaceae bacterium]